MSSQVIKTSKPKKDDRVKNSRRWTSEEKALFADILADTDNNFLLVINKLALKCSSNEEVFGHVKNIFEIALQDQEFINTNERRNFTDNKGNIKPYEKLDTSVSKLRNQLKTLKKEWRKITDRIKYGSGLAGGEEPVWYAFLNAVLAETNEEINPTSPALQTFFVREENDTDREKSLSEDEPLMPDEDSEHADLEDDESQNSKRPKKKLVAAVHKKRTQIRSNKQALTEVAKAMQNMAESQVKRMKMMIDAEEKREEKRRKDRIEEAERNSNHELEIAKIYATAFASVRQSANQNQSSSMELIPGQLSPPQSTPRYRFLLNEDPAPTMTIYTNHGKRKSDKRTTPQNSSAKT